MANISMYRCSKSTRTVLIVVVISLIWLNVYITSVLRQESPNRPNEKDQKRSEEKYESFSAIGNNNGGGMWNAVELGRLGTPAFINVPDQALLSSSEIKDITQEILAVNKEQKIYNQDKFGPITDATFVIVIQVHSRVEYLSLLVESLSRVPEIDNALVIFSHDIYIPGLNEAIQNIDFARVMQIFYPHSIQLNPNRFPGQSPDDCPRDISPAKARAKNCRNAKHPDLHGHYREARYTQTKHHWWWKANHIFGRVNVLQNYTGVIAFLEEDHYVTPDFLWVLNLMETDMMQNVCHGCNLIALGTYLKTWNIRSANSRGVVTNWVSSKHNMGMGFNRTLWEKMRHCAPTFCSYDDYNWDWSLLFVSDTCLPAPLEVYYAKAPRIFHIGDCGVHHKKENCDPSSSAQAIDKGVKQYHSLLFPDKLSIEVRRGKKMRLKKGNGGWGDIRDHKLCLSFNAAPAFKFKSGFANLIDAVLPR